MLYFSHFFNNVIRFELEIVNFGHENSKTNYKCQVCKECIIQIQCKNKDLKNHKTSREDVIFFSLFFKFQTHIRHSDFF